MLAEEAYTDSLGQTWSADTDFSGGNLFGTTNSISKTSDAQLYQTERFGSFSYHFSVPNGNYNVVLKFAEIYWSSPGQRVFNVSINGTQVLTNFDIVAAAGGPRTAIDKAFPVTVNNGAITVQFILGLADWPKVSAIEVIQGATSTTASTSSSSTTSSTTSTTSVRVHAGGGAYTDSLGQTWSADTDFSGGNLFGTTNSISKTSDFQLYQTERFGSFSYHFSVPNGSYNVVLKFAEIYFPAPGERIFNVAINGTQVLTNFDIVSAAGGPLTAIDKTFPVTVNNGAITIQFITGPANWPKVSAISLVPSTSAVTTPTPVSTAIGQLSLSQTSFAFGNVDIGTTASKIFTVSNKGTAALTFSGVSISGAGFNATGVSSGVVLSPGQSTTFTASFTPAATGSATGSIVFTSNAANSSATIALSGTGAQQPAVSHAVVLSWDASTGSDVIGYYVYRATTSGGPFTALNASPTSATTYTDTGVSVGQTFYYVVTAVTSSNSQSGYSNVASGTIP